MMNSIFDIDEDLDFSDDDILDVNIFAKSSQPNSSSGKEEINNVCRIDDKKCPGKGLQTKTASIFKENDGMGSPVQTLQKNHSCSTSRLKNVSSNIDTNLQSGEHKLRNYPHRFINEFTNDMHFSWQQKGPLVDLNARKIKESSSLSPSEYCENGKAKFTFRRDAITTHNHDNADMKCDNSTIFHNFKKLENLERTNTGMKRIEKLKRNPTGSNNIHVENSREYFDSRTWMEDEDLSDRFLDGSPHQTPKKRVKEDNSVHESDIYESENSNMILMDKGIPGSPGDDIVSPVKKQKFPGPAGLLPKLHAMQDFDKLTTPSKSAKKRIATPKVIDSPVSFIGKGDRDFKQPFWLKLKKEALSKYNGLAYHSISVILRKARFNQLEKGKVPLMCALIKTVTVNGHDTSIILKDPTGEIQGTIHKGILENCQSGLSPGAGIILKQVSIFSPSSRKHYVNITPSNIMLLSPPGSSSLSQSLLSSEVQPVFEYIKPIEKESKGSTFEIVETSESVIQEDENLNALLADDDDDFANWIENSEDML